MKRERERPYTFIIEETTTALFQDFPNIKIDNSCKSRVLKWNTKNVL